MPEIADKNQPVPSLAENAAEGDLDAEVETVDFLPKRVSLAFITAWILLFSGRWLLVQGLMAAGLLGQDQTDLLDEKVLTPCYLLLLSTTIAVFMVKIARGMRPGASAAEAATERAVTGTESAIESAMQSDASAERGKQA